MFEEMRQPGFASRLVGRADLVPDHVRHHRCAMIGYNDDFQTIRQGEMAELGAGMGAACPRAPKRDDKQQDFGYLHLRLAVRRLSVPADLQHHTYRCISMRSPS